MALVAVTQISVVIPTVARSALLLKVLAAFAIQEPAEIVLVLDGPARRPEVVDAAARCPGVRLVPLPCNQGAGVARAAGIEAARSELVLLVDDDIVPAPGFVDGHRRAHRGHRNRVVVGCIPVALPQRRRGRDVAAYACAESYEQSVARWRDNPETILDGLWAGNVSARRDVFSKVGRIELRYFEDLELGLCLREAGGEGFFAADVQGEHRFEKSTAGFVRESIARGEGAAQLARLRGEVPSGIATNAHEPAGVRGRVIAALAALSALPGAHQIATALITLPGWLRMWRLQAQVAGAARIAIEHRAYTKTLRDDRGSEQAHNEECWRPRFSSLPKKRKRPQRPPKSVTEP